MVGALALAARIEREATPVPVPRADHAFHRDGEVWTLAYRGREIRIRDSKGLRDLHALLARPGTAHDEVYTAGDAYYGTPGHLPLLFAGTELVEFSPTGPLTEMMGVLGKNLEAARADLTGGA